MIPERIALWPGVAPGSEGLTLAERIDESSPEPDAFHDRSVCGVTVPSLEVFRPQIANRASILLAPGGAYSRVVFDKEGSEIARWLTTLGFTVFVLKYRLPGEGHAQQSDVPLQDAQRAIRLIRAQADDWTLDADRIGVMGFSAGGHLAASLVTRHQQNVYVQVDGADVLSARPDFAILIYPVINMRAPLVHAGSRLALLGDAPSAEQLGTYSCDEQVRTDAPPHFISVGADDAVVPVANSLSYYQALLAAGVSAELHVFEHGEHGHAIRFAQGPVGAWTRLLASWLATR